MGFHPRLLVTRAEPDAEAMASRIKALGGHAILAPMRVETPVFGPTPQGIYDAIVATSARAYRLGSPLPEALWAKPCFVVGPATAMAAREIGFHLILEAEGNARALAREVRDWPEPLTRILYLAGQPRKTDLETELRSEEIQIDVWLRYKMAPVYDLPQAAQEVLAAGHCDGVLHWSAESALTYAMLIRKAGLEAPGWKPIQFCLSEAIAALLVKEARQTGFDPAIRIGSGSAREDFIAMAIRDLRPMP